jgi:outer membrane protein
MKTFCQFFFLLVSMAFIIPSKAQEPWSLEQCVNYSIEHNIQIKQKQVQAEISKSNLTQSKAGLLPSVTANGQDAWQFGRSIDPYTNEFTDNNFQTVSMSINANLTLFNGLQQYNTIRQNNYTLLSDLEDVEDSKNNITLQVCSSYLQILFDMELLAVTSNQLAITNSQVERTKILVNAGSLAKSNLLEIQAQMASEELAKINAENNLKTSYLTLTQLLELDTTADFKIKIPELTDPSETFMIDSVKKIYEESLDLPLIKKQEYSLKSSEQMLKISRGNLSPQFYISASYGTGYSDARNRMVYGDSVPVPIGFVGSSNENVFSMMRTSSSANYSFWDQLNDNRSLSVAVGVQIPIFNRLSTKNRMTQARLNVENSKYMLEVTKNQLYKDIQSARNSAESSLVKFKASQKAVEAQQESFSYTQQRFDLGLVNSVDYNTAKNQLTKIQSDMVQAKYEFIFRINILNFYQGIPIKL